MELIDEHTKPERVTTELTVGNCTQALETLLRMHGKKGKIRQTIEFLEKNLSDKYFSNQDPHFTLKHLRESSETGNFNYSFEIYKQDDIKLVIFDLEKLFDYQALRLEVETKAWTFVTNVQVNANKSFLLHYAEERPKLSGAFVDYFYNETQPGIIPSLVRESQSRERSGTKLVELTPYQALKKNK